jgi:hypothetical protein
MGYVCRAIGVTASIRSSTSWYQGEHGGGFARLPGRVDDKVALLIDQPLDSGHAVLGGQHVVNIGFTGTGGVEPAHGGGSNAEQAYLFYRRDPYRLLEG